MFNNPYYFQNLFGIQVDVETVSDSNIGQYSIYDVVLPLPGFTVKYPGNQGMLRLVINQR